MTSSLLRTEIIHFNFYRLPYFAVPAMIIIREEPLGELG